MKWLKWTAIGAGALLAIVVLFIAWVLNTQAGARWAAGIAEDVLAGHVAIGAVEGRIAGPLVVSDVRYRDRAAGIDLRAQRIAIDIAIADLLRAVAHVKSMDLRGIDLVLHEPTQPQPPPDESQPFSLQPPIDIVIDSLTAANIAVRRDNETLVEVTKADFAGHWTEEDLAIKQLDVQSPQGEIHFAGRVDEEKVYVGEGKGRFRWSAGSKTYAGALQTVAAGEDANLAVTLTSPLNAQLDVVIEQAQTWPWRFKLDVPRFDPREELLPDSSLQSLAAELSGEGSIEAGTVTGRVLINGEPLHLESLRFARGEQKLSIESVLSIGDPEGGETAGEFHANGEIELAREPWFADFSADWRDVVIPVLWAGQELHTHGQLEASGNTEAFNARGELALGPPDRIANIALDLSGSPEALQLAQFDIVQEDGRLAASGQIDLQPVIAWDVVASGRGFDPGAFAAAWRGDLDFDLASAGRMTEEGPTATLQLDDLHGELRGRTLSGNADLSLTPTLTPAGTLTLRSGESELRFEGERGDAIDATIAFDIDSLNDWVPDSGGRLTGDFTARGRWPELAIAGNARGRELNAANVRIETLALDVDVENPRNPQGDVQLDLTELTAAGLEFATVRARASGEPEAHRLEVHATGEPLALDLGVQGARTEGGWSGSVQNLVLDIQDAARLALREPVRIVVAKGATEVSRACLADGQIELCAAGNLRQDGSLQASYSLANVPLALANVVASADLPLQFAGSIQGRGDIRRTPAGELFGDILIESPSGRVSQGPVEPSGEAPAEEARTLLSYDDLRIAASLAGADARASINATLEENGSLSGDASLRGLGQAETPVSGRLSATIPDLAPLGVFATQLANVHGRAEARVGIAGTLQAPQIDGQLSATELTADIPAIGLQLKNGRFEVRPTSEGEFELSGGVESGDGRLEFAGAANPSGAVEVNINGDRFLAADIPGARVIVTPDLRFVRANERMKLTGKVTIPEATVNLQKLPRGERAQAPSPDVVVIDARTQEDEAAEAPLFADITVIIGEDVELIGFGLQAQVEGQIEVHERPGEPTTGSGEVRVSGTYKAYGQDLTIQKGRLLYAATPLDNPRLSIEATRKVDDVVAGLRIRGNARSPELTVFSDPAMGQANALSYLVAGKPLDDIGAEDAEGDAMQTAARSLGTAASGLLAKSIGRRLGVDELAVKDSEVIGGAALTVGQYLSPRLYLSYGVGLFEPGDVVTLLYELSEDLALKAQRGPEDTRAGIEYRIER